ncbi:MAG: hypothetical protein WAU15_08030 [Nitrosomonas sp.]
MGWVIAEINRQIKAYDITVKQGCHVDASITQSLPKPKTKLAYEVVNDREERGDETEAEKAMQVIEVTQPVSMLKHDGS